MTENNGNKLSIPRKIGIPALHQRLRAPEADATDPSRMSNRIALMLDASVSMAGTDTGNKPKIDCLRDAMQSFITSCNMRDTALAIESFGDSHRSRLALTCFAPILMTTAMSIEACGSTPLHEAMDYVLMTYSVTRGVVVSDGNADSETQAIDCAGRFAEAGIPIDCVHIGTSPYGEALLKQIAERTGGKFIKFTDVSAFASNFKYLTPAYYGQLTSGSVSAAQLGAKEIK